MTDVMSIANEIIELAFITGLEAGKRSELLEPKGLSATLNQYSWAVLLHNVDVSKALTALGSQKTCGHAQVYASTIGKTSITISGPPSTMAAFFQQNQFLHNSQKLHLPIAAAFHAEHLQQISYDQVCRAASQSLLSMEVKHPYLMSTNSGDFIKARNLGELLPHVLRDILQRPIALGHIARGLDEQLTAEVACFSFGPDSVASPIKPLLASRLAGMPGVPRQCRRVELPISTSLDARGDDPEAPSVDPCDIAIIGMGLRLPGSETLEEFWSVLEDGRDLHRPVPPDRFDLSTHYDPSGTKPNTSRTPYGVFIERPGWFDRHVFKMSPREALQTDPQQRLLLLATYEALEIAGYSPDRQQGAFTTCRIGSYIGQTGDDWREVNSSQEVDTYFIPGGMRAFGPGKLHYHFGWEGPSYSIDTACSSSASAIQLAVSSLLAGDCDMAIGGGVNFLSAPDVFAGLSRGGFLSPSGGCKTFDDAADGYCRADAVGVVVLKRLSDAMRDRDVVHAVLRGALTNHSAEAISITHPHAATQQRLFTRLLSDLSLNPTNIDYVEMHGTGTQAGDAIEMSSVVNTLAGGHRTATDLLYVGSVKPNMGHGEGGSGVTSLIKAVLMLRKNLIPPHVGIKGRINRNFADMEQSHTRLAYVSTPFLRKANSHEPRRILVNNFDAAGGNTSLIIQDPPPLRIQGIDPRPCHVIIISGKTKYSILENAKRLLGYLNGHPNIGLGDLGYTTTARRIQQYPYRRAFAKTSLNGLRRSLEQTIEDEDSNNQIAEYSVTKSPFVVFAFTGQGCQYSHMASGLYHTYPSFRNSLNSMADICVSHGFSSFLPLITEASFDISRASPVELQTGIVAIELAMINLWEDIGVSPDAVIGHSLGEFSALCTAGVISVAACLYLVGHRAALLVKGCTAGTFAMLAVHQNLQSVERHLSSAKHQDDTSPHQNGDTGLHDELGSACEVACINSGKSTAVSGPVRQIELLRLKLHGEGVRTTLLDVPYGYHSSQMDNILDDFESAAETINFLAPRIPVASTALGSLITEHGIINPGYLRRQTRDRVRFSQAVNSLLSEDGLTKNRRPVWIEVGPQPTCLGLLRSLINHSGTTDRGHILLPSMKKDGDDCQTLATAMATLYEAGVDLDWKRHHKPFEQALRLLELPTYAFDLENYWIQYEGDWSQRKGRKCSDTPFRMAGQTQSLYQVVKEDVTTDGISITFTSDMSDPRFLNVIQGHRMNSHALCPSSLYAEMALSVAQHTQRLTSPASSSSKLSSCMNVRNMEVYQALVAEPGSQQHILITASRSKGSNSVKIHFESEDGSLKRDHAKCEVVFGDGVQWQLEWRQASALVMDRISLLTSSSHTHRILRPMAYKLFAALVDYGQQYQGMQEVHLDSNLLEATAEVRFPISGDDQFLYHPCWIDSLAHISGFVLNATETTPSDAVYISHGWQSMRIAVEKLSADKTYYTYVRMKEDVTASKVMVGDVYILEDGNIIALVEGLKFRQMKRFQLNHLLPPGKRIREQKYTPEPTEDVPREPGYSDQRTTTKSSPRDGAEKMMAITNGNKTEPSIIDTIFGIIAQEVGVDVSSLSDHNMLADSGIDSLLSLSIAARVSDAIGLEIPSGLILASASLGELRESLSQRFQAPGPTPNTAAPPALASNGDPPNGRKTAEPTAQIHLLRGSKARSGAERTLFLLPDGSGHASSYTWLASADLEGAAGPDAIYALDSPFLGGGDAGAWHGATVHDIARSFVRAIRAARPRGPYHLGGWSLGGVFALEAAAQLGDVASLFLVDPPRVRSGRVADADDDDDGEGDACRVGYWFETAEQLIDIANFVDPRHRGDRDVAAPASNADVLQAHFRGSMEVLRNYRPRQLPLSGIRAALVWAKDGVLETLGEEAPASDRPHIAKGSGGSNPGSDWVLSPRHDFGPNGWDLLLPEIEVECSVVKGDHFSIMKAPAVFGIGKLLKDFFSTP
ncbi:putative acyl transferase acyl hydrolase lysophospholipase [Rosellinia necatrix]|uniref:Putative acyl transferase acyl hydrolase lysophospholipase n=1 Tax=Rosellinia necatrix TaxID=77044 RepID=A0A1W2TNE5_ROSNE|nr:putative acyl transferase acyl hydrolase lysophospholipase [Rosellinia necatrix]